MKPETNFFSHTLYYGPGFSDYQHLFALGLLTTTIYLYLFLSFKIMEQFGLSWFENYWSFLNRPLSNRVENQTGIWSSVFHEIPNFIEYTALWSLFFSVLFIAVPFLTSLAFSEWYKSLDKRKRREYPSYLVCLVHHIALVPLAWMLIIRDSGLNDAEATNFDYIGAIGFAGPFCIGYLVGDTIFFALSEVFHGKYEYICHHILSLYLVISTLLGPGPLCRFIPHLLICDTTNLLFNTAWLLRLAGYKDTKLVITLELLFTTAFFFLRVINMPLMFLAVLGYQSHFESMGSTGLGFAKYTLLPIAALQWFWFYKIMTTFIKRMNVDKRKVK